MRILGALLAALTALAALALWVASGRPERPAVPVEPAVGDTGAPAPATPGVPRAAVADEAGEADPALRPAEGTPASADPVPVAGRVLDEYGGAVDEATVRLVVRGEDAGSTARTDAAGAFRLEAPAGGGVVLTVTRRGCHDARVEVPSRGADDLVVHVVSSDAREEPGDLVVVGWVRDPGGAPLPGALVRMGPRGSVAAADGSFRVPGVSITRGDPLVAALPGWQPAILADPVFADDGLAPSGAREIGPVTLVLEPGALEITGRLVDAAGEGQAGWFLTLDDGTALVPNSAPSTLAEDLAGACTNLQVTAADGGFRLRGLRAGGSYRLRAWNERTMQSAQSEPVPAGARDWRFVLPYDEPRPRVYGRLVGLDGAPLADVRVRLTMVAHRTPRTRTWHSEQDVRTGADGRFELRDVPHGDLFLRFHGAGVVARPYDLGVDDPGTDLVIELPRQCRFRFERTPGAPPPAADSFALFDARHRMVAVKRSGGYGEPEPWPLPGADEDGDFRVSEEARFLVLYGDGRELERIVLDLAPGETRVVRL